MIEAAPTRPVRRITPPSTPTRAEERSTRAETLPEMILRAGEVHAGTALREKRGGRWVDRSYRELVQDVRAVARGLIALGIEPGDRVAILSDTRPEWTVADFGALCAGAVVVPVYQTSSAEETRYVLAHSDARAVFCENAAQVAKVAEIREACPVLDHVIVLEGEAEEALTLAGLVALGAETSPGEVDRRVAASSPDALATLVYTSGTTGPPKGCMLTHGNFLATARMYEHQLELDGDVVIFLFLPLAHALARVTQMVTLDVGGTLAFWTRDPKRILEDLREARPTHFPSVPRVFEKIFTAAQAGVEEQGRAKRAVAGWALDTGRKARERERRGLAAGPLLRAQLRLADKVLLSKVRGLFGGDLQLALTGAAPIAKDVLEFFDSCGIVVLEGYGMTETCAAATLNTVTALRFGTVGRPLPGCSIGVEPDGELLIGGPNVFLGYFKNDDATRETLDGGRVRTGDLGGLDPDGYTSITGRKKDLIITSSGKNITPSNIENHLREIRWISEAVVYGDRRSYLVALLTLDPDGVPALAERVGVAPDRASMATDPAVLEAIGAAVEEVNSHFARIEQIKRFAILPHDLTLEGGELTPTLKVKRQVVYRRYADVFERLYEEGGS